MRTGHFTGEEKAELVEEMLPGFTLERGKVVKAPDLPICPLCQRPIQRGGWVVVWMNNMQYLVHRGRCPSG